MTARIKAAVGFGMCVGLGLLTWTGFLPGKADAG
jgi:hypothetical protein